MGSNSRISESGTNKDKPSPVRLKAKSSFDLRGCRISRPQLERIWELSRAGFPPDSYVSITTIRKASVIESELKGDSIDELLDNVRRATLPGDPNFLDNLYFSISFWNLGGGEEEEEERTVSIRFDTTGIRRRVRVLVKGEDPGWVRGRIGGLRDLFAETQSHVLTGRGYARARLLLASIFVMVVIVPILAFTSFHHLSAAAGLSIIFGLYGLMLGGAFLVGARLDSRFGARLLLFPETQKREVDWINVGVLIGTIIGALVTLVGAIIAHSDAVHPH